MADINHSAEPTFPAKRIPDLTTPDLSKKPKLDNPDNNNINNNRSVPENDDVHEDKSISEQKEEEEEALNGKAVIDRKGKGILIEEDEGEDEEEDDSDDDSDDSDSSDIGGELSDDSDFVEDPLAEVDLDNILPSRTRRKIINPGTYLATDLPPEDSDDSDDPDA